MSSLVLLVSPRALFATLVTNRRRVHDQRRRSPFITGSSFFVVLTWGPPASSLHEVCLEISPVFVFLRILFARWENATSSQYWTSPHNNPGQQPP